MPSALPTLVSLGAGRQQLPLIDAALGAGLAVVSVDREPEAPGHARATHPLVLSTHEPEPIVAALAELEGRLEVRGIVCRSTGKALETQAHLTRVCGVAGLTPEAVRIATSKAELRRFCEAHRLPMPAGARVAGDGWVNLEPPLVVKPDYTVVGKKDVRRVASTALLPDAIADAAASSWNGLAEVEAFVDGVDVACVFWADRGRASVLALYDEVLAFGPDGAVVPLGVSMPTQVDDAARRRIAELAGSFASALERTTALLILCVRVDADGAPHVIELHADLGGDRIADELLPASLPDFDYFDTVVRLATGSPVTLPDREPQPAALIYRGATSSGASHLDAAALVHADSRTDLLALLAREVARRGAEVAVPPPMLRLAA